MSREGEPAADPESPEHRTLDAAPAASSRGLADILREAGINPTGGGGRRRRDDADTGEAEAAAAAAAEAAAEDTAPATPAAADSTETTDDGTAEQDTQSDRTAITDGVPPDERWSRTDTGPLPTHGWVTPGTGADAGTRYVPSARPSTHTDSVLTVATGPVESEATTASSPATRPASQVSISPGRAPDPEDSAPPRGGGAVSWAILFVELLAALGLGVAAWYAFSALWELLPYVAAFAGPLVVTGLVAVAGALRARTGRARLGLPTLCILVFAGTVLVVLPAATVIVP